MCPTLAQRTGAMSLRTRMPSYFLCLSDVFRLIGIGMLRADIDSADVARARTRQNRFYWIPWLQCARRAASYLNVNSDDGIQ